MKPMFSYCCACKHWKGAFSAACFGCEQDSPVTAVPPTNYELDDTVRIYDKSLCPKGCNECDLKFYCPRARR